MFWSAVTELVCLVKQVQVKSGLLYKTRKQVACLWFSMLHDKKSMTNAVKGEGSDLTYLRGGEAAGGKLWRSFPSLSTL